MNLYHTTFPTRFGAFSLAVDGTGAVHATAFGDLAALHRRLPAAAAAPAFGWVADDDRTAAARDQVFAYGENGSHGFDLAVAAPGTAFQRRVWAELRRIPAGQTRTYGDIARALGTSARAVGRANATNPVCLIVPCHRVIGADGALTGFAFGGRLKQQLLTHESAR